jgi:hypothetical protein
MLNQKGYVSSSPGNSVKAPASHRYAERLMRLIGGDLLELVVGGATYVRGIRDNVAEECARPRQH